MPVPLRYEAAAILDAWRAVPLEDGARPWRGREWWYATGGPYWRAALESAGILDTADTVADQNSISWSYPVGNAFELWAMLEGLAAASDDYQAVNGAAPVPAVDLKAYVDRTTSWGEYVWTRRWIWEPTPASSKPLASWIGRLRSELRAWRASGYRGTAAPARPRRSWGAALIAGLAAVVLLRRKR